MCEWVRVSACVSVCCTHNNNQTGLSIINRSEQRRRIRLPHAAQNTQNRRQKQHTPDAACGVQHPGLECSSSLPGHAHWMNAWMCRRVHSVHHCLRHVRFCGLSLSHILRFLIDQFSINIGMRWDGEWEGDEWPGQAACEFLVRAKGGESPLSRQPGQLFCRRAPA